MSLICPMCVREIIKYFGNNKYLCFGNCQIYVFWKQSNIFFGNSKIFLFWKQINYLCLVKELNISILEIIKYLSFGNKQMQNFGSNSNPGG